MANESVSISQHARFARGTNATQNFRFLAERWTLARLRHQRVFSLVELSAAIRPFAIGALCRRPRQSGAQRQGKECWHGRDVAGWWDRAPEQGRAAVAGCQLVGQCELP